MNIKQASNTPVDTASVAFTSGAAPSVVFKTVGDVVPVFYTADVATQFMQYRLCKAVDPSTSPFANSQTSLELTATVGADTTRQSATLSVSHQAEPCFFFLSLAQPCCTNEGTHMCARTDIHDLTVYGYLHTQTQQSVSKVHTCLKSITFWMARPLCRFGRSLLHGLQVTP